MSKEKHRPVRAMFPDVYNLSSEDIASSDILKDLLRVEVPKSIRQAFKEKKQYASVFEINDSSYYLDLHKKDWISALETCILFNTESENYEVCSEINGLMAEINKANKSPKIKIKKDD